MKIKNVLFILITAGLFGCAGMTQKLDANRAKSVRKLAIFAVEVHQQQPTDNLGLGAIKSISEGKDSDSVELQSMAFKVANNFASEIQKKTKWQIIPIKDVAANVDYKAKFTAANSGLHMVSMTGNSMVVINAQGLLDVTQFRKMSIPERAKLAKSLGVDAVAEITIVNTLDESMFSIGHLTGDGAYAMTSRANLQVYDLNSEDPLWVSQNVDGEPTAKSDELPANLSKRERLAKLGEQAAGSAVKNLVQTYKF
jgi:hypothetical protein